MDEGDPGWNLEESYLHTGKEKSARGLTRGFLPVQNNSFPSYNLSPLLLQDQGSKSHSLTLFYFF